MTARVGRRVVGALDHRQQGKLHGHAALVDFPDDVVQVAAAALDHAAQRVRVIQIPLLVMENQRVVDVGHREALTHALVELSLIHI